MQTVGQWTEELVVYGPTLIESHRKCHEILSYTVQITSPSHQVYINSQIASLKAAILLDWELNVLANITR